jgi:competence protein ComEA
MPTRTGRPDAAAEIATRLSELRLSSSSRAPAGERAAAAPGGWLPEQPRLGEPAPAAVVVAPAGVAAPPSLASLLRAWVADRLPLWAHDVTGRVSRGTVLTVIAVVVALVLGAFVVVHHRSGGSTAYAGSSWPGSSSPDPSAAGGSTSSSTSSSAGTASAASTASDSIVVDVGGRVRRPGLVTLPPGSRVADAIAAAGGALRRKDVATTDLAAKVGDGQLLLIGPAASGGAAAASAGDTSGGGSSTDGSGSSAPVSLSSADLTTLETLPGVGPVTAQKIIDWRTAHNGFTSIEQLQQVPGIGPSHYAEVEALVTP